jgi:hypothetical protein
MSLDAAGKSACATSSRILYAFSITSSGFGEYAGVMAAQKGLSLAYDKRLGTASGRPEWPAAEGPEPQLNVQVVFTSVPATLAALKAAAGLASRLKARVNLVVPQVVPYPCPLDSPPVLLDFNERRFRTIAAESQIDTTVQLYLCRDRWETLKNVLKPRSLVVVGGRKRWWPTHEERLAAKLRRAGHEVVFAETE